MVIILKKMNILLMLCKSDMNVIVMLGIARLVAAKDLWFQIHY